MVEIPDGSIALLSHLRHNVGKDYDEDLSVDEYIDLIYRVGAECTGRLLRRKVCYKHC